MDFQERTDLDDFFFVEGECPGSEQQNNGTEKQQGIAMFLISSWIDLLENRSGDEVP